MARNDTTRGGRTRKKGQLKRQMMAVQADKSFVALYYPIYIRQQQRQLLGQKLILFGTPTSAFTYSCISAIRDSVLRADQLEDGTGAGIHEVLRCVGVVYIKSQDATAYLDWGRVPSTVYSGASPELEVSYFGNTKAAVLDPCRLTSPFTMFMLLDPELVRTCLRSLKSRPDYMMSTNSIIPRGSTCIQSPPSRDWFHFKLDGGPGRDIFSFKCQDDFYRYRHRSKCNVETVSGHDLSSQVLKYLSSGRFDGVVISLCCGACETELYAPPSTLMVCLDISSACISAASSNYQLSNKKNMILGKFDMKHTSYLLNSITKGVAKRGIFLKATVLFQHPSPNVTNSMKVAFQACIGSLKDGVFTRVIIVYDSKPGGNCWSRDKVLQAFESEEEVYVSEEVNTLTKDNRTVLHPSMGLEVPRVGWALMKSGASFVAKELAVQVQLKNT